ncbi:hypothetical protein K458DRAFT_428786 [Lentithecium fluviatile CBS 122367]|uniref:Uncharacterized protein n=1 Tax=Lentithecium fluviatile CBS 122367 TaxID=1168545 RepID=A0A6G1JCP3_9PLEO|nr:hypothetical protein K458DRAFT_428786 [Lentithecium fluviatile CBS 122367]
MSNIFSIQTSTETKKNMERHKQRNGAQGIFQPQTSKDAHGRNFTLAFPHATAPSFLDRPLLHTKPGKSVLKRPSSQKDHILDTVVERTLDTTNRYPKKLGQGTESMRRPHFLHLEFSFVVHRAVWALNTGVTLTPGSIFVRSTSIWRVAIKANPQDPGVLSSFAASAVVGYIEGPARVRQGTPDSFAVSSQQQSGSHTVNVGPIQYLEQQPSFNIVNVGPIQSSERRLGSDARGFILTLLEQQQPTVSSVTHHTNQFSGGQQPDYFKVYLDMGQPSNSN